MPVGDVYPLNYALFSLANSSEHTVPQRSDNFKSGRTKTVTPVMRNTGHPLHDFSRLKNNIDIKFQQPKVEGSTAERHKDFFSSIARKEHNNRHKNVLHMSSDQSSSRHQWFSRLLNYLSSAQGPTNGIPRKRFSKRKLLFPWETSARGTRTALPEAMSPSLSSESPTTAVPIATTPKGGHDGEGCPWNLSWCAHVPVLHLAQYAVGTLLYGVGYPLCHVLTFTIFSKVLGSKPQVSRP